MSGLARCLALLSFTLSAPALATPESNAEAILGTRFAAMQSIVRSGQPLYAIKIVSGDQSIHQQMDDGVVRISVPTIRAAKSSEVLDMVLLIGLSQATYNPQKPYRLITGAARVATDILGIVGQQVAESRVESAGRSNAAYDQVGQRREENEIQKPASLRPAERAFIWAKSVGGCEARIVDGLTRIAKAERSQDALDAQRTLADLGPVAWTPNTKCIAPMGDADYRALLAGLSG